MMKEHRCLQFDLPNLNAQCKRGFIGQGESGHPKQWILLAKSVLWEMVVAGMSFSPLPVGQNRDLNATSYGAVSTFSISPTISAMDQKTGISKCTAEIGYLLGSLRPIPGIRMNCAAAVQGAFPFRSADRREPPVRNLFLTGGSSANSLIPVFGANPCHGPSATARTFQRRQPSPPLPRLEKSGPKIRSEVRSPTPPFRRARQIHYTATGIARNRISKRSGKA